MSKHLSLASLVVVLAVAPAGAQQVTKENVPGVTNFAKLETTVACGGATKAEAVPELKKMGFASIINLRLASEQGANVEEEATAAKAAGIKYYHLPFNTTGEHDVAGYWIIPVCVILGILALRATHSLARRFLTNWRERRALAGTGHFVG